MADKPEVGDQSEKQPLEVGVEDERLERFEHSDAATPAVAEAELEAQSGVEIHYMKSNHFRVIHADGAVGAITPRGLVHMTLYSERAAIPKRGFRAISVDGQSLESEEFTETIGGVVRELEVDVLMDKAIVLQIRDWLTRRLDELATVKDMVAQAEKAKK